MEIFREAKFASQVIRGVVTSILATLIGVLIFAFILSVTNLGDGIIKPINQIIKLIAVFLGCFLSVKGEKGFLKGGLIGLLSTLITIVLFAILSGGIASVLVVLIDCVCGLIMGALSGAISVNVKKS